MTLRRAHRYDRGLLPSLDAPLKPPSATRQPLPFGKYLLLDRIGVGGMAEVWRARVADAGGAEHLVAIKRILPSIAEDAEFIAMFVDEARLCRQLAHPNIAQVYELGEHQGSYFIAMEYIPGKNLRALFEGAQRRGEALPPALVAYCGAQLARGLDAAHRQRDGAGQELHIVHLDVSPQNVVVSYEGEVKVIDFGIARAAGMAPRSRAGLLKGKFGYLSPEQVRGQAPDRRSDVFAVGVCLHELLTGERLFTGETDLAVLEAVREARVAPPSQRNPAVPPELERIVLRALARDVEARYAHASELAEDLQRFLAEHAPGVSREHLAGYMRTAFAAQHELEARQLREFPRAPLPLGGARSEASASSGRRRTVVALAALSAAAAAAGSTLRREPPHGLLLLDVPVELRGVARVSVNGQELGAQGPWPLLQRVPAGPGVVRVSAPGREPVTLSVRVAPAPQLTRVEAAPRLREPVQRFVPLEQAPGAAGPTGPGSAAPGGLSAEEIR